MSTQTQKKINFHFVTGNPRTDSEKRTVRTIVRSNASNRRWRLVRESAAKSKGSEDDLDFDGQPDGATFETASNSSISEPETTPKTKSKRQRLNQRLIRRESHPQSNGQNSHPPVSPMKVKNLAQYYFGSMPTSEVSEQSISRMLQGTATSYTALFPSGRGNPASSMARDWFQQCLKTRGILHTALFCQAMRAQAMHPGWTAMSGNELVLCQTEAVHAINDKLQNSATACDDESIRIVFSLTWHGAIKDDAAPKSPRQAPMADLQALRLFMGIIGCDPIHARGLDKMLALRGGLDDITMPGLAFLVSYGDILMASCNLSRPVWSYGSYAQFVPEAEVDEEWRRSTHRTDHPLSSLGMGFSALHRWLSCDRASQLQLVFADMADYTRATYDFIHGPAEKRNRAVMADQRNSLQHRLMSLRMSDNDRSEGSDIHELCWLAGVAYSMIVVFPLSPKAAQFDRLARLIRSKMVTSAVINKWSQAPAVALWMTVIGSLCAIGTPDRGWFVDVLRQETARSKISTWQDLKRRLMDFLWFPLSSDADGEDLWLESRPQNSATSWELHTDGG